MQRSFESRMRGMTPDQDLMGTGGWNLSEVTPDEYWIIEGSLEVKLLTIWTDEKQRWEESERRGE